MSENRMRIDCNGEKYAKVAVYLEDTVYITANLNDFDGDVQKWKLAFYELWRYQMTWHFAHEISVFDNSRSGVFVRIICKPSYEKCILGTMEELGFRNIHTEHDNIGTIECSELPEEMLIDFAVVDY